MLEHPIPERVIWIAVTMHGKTRNGEILLPTIIPSTLNLTMAGHFYVQ